MRYAGIALLVAAVLATGCGGIASGDRVELLTAELGCYAGGESWSTDELVADAEHGTTFTGRPVVWPSGFTGRRAESEVEVLDAAGNVRATTGRRYWIATAYPLESLPGDQFPAAVDCGYPWDFGECDGSGEAFEYCHRVAP